MLAEGTRRSNKAVYTDATPWLPYQFVLVYSRLRGGFRAGGDFTDLLQLFSAQ